MTAQPRSINDVPARLVGIPLLAFLIPNLTGILDYEHMAWPLIAASYGWFVLLSAAIWQGNRFLLFTLRARYDWLNQPLEKLLWLVGANVLYTAPLTFLMLSAWYLGLGQPVDWHEVAIVTLVNVICVLIVTHAYETVFLIKQTKDDALRVAQLERAKAEMELASLKNQLDPHFMFNSLNTLSWLIENQPARALTFSEHLADVYRYILSNRNRELVLLKEELTFLQHYFALLQIRFGEAVHLTATSPLLKTDAYLIPPISLQLLLENAVKHNEFSEERPLQIEYRLEDDFISFTNPIRRKRSARRSAKVGLRNLNERCQLLTNQGIEILLVDDRYTVRLPILNVSA
ncbi:Sensor histidine kinase YesM [Catalinimonas alkaloidigena]|uniref:Sensor histidine kinase YesM n=1 Tax=Catalinimonas alkaloidigena TaxID=1075417 RepID=A0A1G9ITZ0_9BACT|nr:sensor histidine kinase [Catalinimonas alkaloidigena]SDL28758.1 Sensor histidine kinase YesM [Catalinimonas alkaloidigena]